MPLSSRRLRLSAALAQKALSAVAFSEHRHFYCRACACLLCKRRIATEKGVEVKLQDLVHKNAAVIVGGLNMLMNEFLFFLGKPRKSKRTVMFDKTVFWQGVDVKGLHGGERLNVLCNRNDKIEKDSLSDSDDVRMPLPVGFVHGKVGKFNRGNSGKPSLKVLQGDGLIFDKVSFVVVASFALYGEFFEIARKILARRILDREILNEKLIFFAFKKMLAIKRIIGKCDGKCHFASPCSFAFSVNRSRSSFICNWCSSLSNSRTSRSISVKSGFALKNRTRNFENSESGFSLMYSVYGF